MLALELFAWWYGPGWAMRWRRLQENLLGVSHLFSVPILLRTLFAPWRRIVTYPGASLDAKLRAMGDNFVSRCIGFTVRFLVLLCALVMLVITGIVSFLMFLLWPVLPLASLALIVKGLLG